MMTIALTGSIGMGKSTVARMFEKAGIPVFDADAEVRRLQGQDGPLVGIIGERFPGTVIDGLLDRERLAKAVIDDPAELKALEAIVHPAVQAARERFIAGNKDAPAILFEIPLLYETDGEGDFDYVVVVSAPADIQRERVLAREGMNRDKFDGLLARQVPDEQKRARADFVINTGVDLSTTEARVREVLACLGLPQEG